MNKPLPNKWIRKAVFEAINNIDVDGLLIPCFDYRVTNDINSETPKHYIVMSTQSNEVDQSTKCGYYWQSEILIDIFTTYDLPGNPGSRLLADDILNVVRENLINLQIDAASGMEVIKQMFSFPDDLSTTSRNENIFRNFVRVELLIN